MKNLLFTIFTLLNLSIFGQENYKIEIDGKTTDIELDKNYEIKINEKSHIIKISSKDTLIYKSDKFSFKYTKNHKITTSKLEEGINQLMLMTAEGSGVIFQVYDNINPTLLNELMLSEVTKESIGYGYKLKREDYERKLASNKKIKVDKAVLKYKDEINIYEVASFGNKDEGILILTMRLSKEDASSEGEKLINLIWNTLEVN